MFGTQDTGANTRFYLGGGTLAGMLLATSRAKHETCFGFHHSLP